MEANPYSELARLDAANGLQALQDETDGYVARKDNAAIYEDAYVERVAAAGDIVATRIELKLRMGLGDKFHSRPWNKLVSDARERLLTLPANHHAPSPQNSLLALPFNDYGNSERLKLYSGISLRYCHAWRKWLIWDGRRWALDQSGQIMRRAKDTMLEFARLATYSGSDPAVKFASQSLESRRLSAMVQLAECELPVSPDLLDTDVTLLNCRNGTVDLRTGTVRNHNPDDLITKLVDVEFDIDRQAPLFLRTLFHLMGGTPDANEEAQERAAAMVAHLQKAFGYSATGLTSEKVVFIVYGGGDNGKSLVMNTVRNCLGDYAGGILIDSVMNKQESNNAMADLSNLHGRRFVKTSETEEGQRIAEGKLKRITEGLGGKITACRKYENPFEFTETHKLWMDCNHKPVIRGTDAAIWNRIHLIPFSVTIPKAEQDPELKDKLMREQAGILSWIVAGAVCWFRERLGKPPEVQQAISEYRGDMDQIGRFIEEQCVVIEGASILSKRLYATYKSWADEGGEYAISHSLFGSRMKEREGITKRHVAAGELYEGIGLRVRSMGDE